MNRIPNETVVPEWESLRTDESRLVEKILGERFDRVDAYRYNSASLRVRITDSRFERLSHEERDDLVEPVLETLDEETQAEIMNLVLLAPDELEDARYYLANLEFEHPTKSMI